MNAMIVLNELLSNSEPFATLHNPETPESPWSMWQFTDIHGKRFIIVALHKGGGEWNVDSVETM